MGVPKYASVARCRDRRHNCRGSNPEHLSDRRCIPFARLCPHLAAESTATGMTIRLKPTCCVLGDCAASQEGRLSATGQRSAAVQPERLAVRVGSHTMPVSSVDAEMDEGASTQVALHAAPVRLVFQCADPAIRRQLFAAHGLSVERRERSIAVTFPAPPCRTMTLRPEYVPMVALSAYRLKLNECSPPDFPTKFSTYSRS